MAGLRELYIAIICMISFVFFKDRLDFFWVTSDEFTEKNFIYKFTYYMFSAGLIIRAKYYSGFKLTESSVIFCGLSYYRKKKEKTNDSLPDEYEDEFSKIQNIEIYKFEAVIDPLEKLNYWNRTVHYWLKYQVLLRIVNMENKFMKNNFALASLVVFVVSAIWHGFYPGYYLFFVQLYFIQQAAKMLGEKLDFFNRIKKVNILVQMACNFICIFTIGSLGFAFCVLDVKKTIKFYKAFYFTPSIFVFLLYFYLKFFVKRKKMMKTEPLKNPPSENSIGNESSDTNNSEEKSN